MKLWQKVFLFSLTFMILVVDIVAYTVLASTFSSTIDRETEQALRQHESIATSISSQVFIERLSQSVLVLPERTVNRILVEMGKESSDPGTRTAFYYVGRPVSYLGSEVVTEHADFFEMVQEGEDWYTLIADHEGKTFILTGSHLTLETLDYTFFTVTDITEVYHSYAEQQRFVQIVSVASAIFLASGMLLLALRLVRPLSGINDSIRQIAEGDYSLRVSETGGQEFRTLARNVNTMAASIESNVAEIQRVADGRKRFIDNLAHEMKTPLTSVLGMADVLRLKEDMNPQQRQEYIGIIFEETKRLKNLSGKLLSLSATAQFPIDCKQIDAGAFFEEVQAAVDPLLQEKQLRLVCEVEAGVTFYADEELLKSLLYNLIDNAIKASHEQAEIKVACWEDGENICVEVTDYGAGMTPEAIENAKDLFYTNNPSRTKVKGNINLGLGLALCDEIVKRHGGQMKLDSQTGAGTKVRVQLPKRQGGENSEA